MKKTTIPSKKNPEKTNRIPAGCFSSWLRRTRYALAHEKGSVVNCGECRGCCTSSYFIHIRPEETGTLKRINKKLLFPALGLSKGNMLLGYFENGHCPMMVEAGCSIYEDRPLTCRTYDCRIFAATGIPAGEADKVIINEQVKKWQFTYPTHGDRNQHKAVKAAAEFLVNQGSAFPPGEVPSNPSQLAILALKVYKVFLEPMGPDRVSETVQAVIEARDRFNSCGKGERV